jgi:hypothetical protein
MGRLSAARRTGSGFKAPNRLLCLTSGATGFLDHSLRGGRVFSQHGCRPDRPRHEIALAIGAAVIELVLRAIGAKGAFERTDDRLIRFRRKIAAAAFATGSKFQHVFFLYLIRIL